jgi:hypothetical protein
MANLPGSAPGAAHQVPGHEPLFRIGEGVRRSLAARQIGKSEIAAVELKSDGSTADLGHVPLSSLFVDVNKSSIVMDQRWLDALKAVGRGAAHPIEVIAITAEKAKVLLPLARVTMKHR